MSKIKINETMIHGFIEPGFEEVKEEFINNFTKGEEVGAACAAYYQGKKVVDLNLVEKAKNIAFCQMSTADPIYTLIGRVRAERA